MKSWLAPNAHSKAIYGFRSKRQFKKTTRWKGQLVEPRVDRAALIMFPNKKGQQE